MNLKLKAVNLPIYTVLRNWVLIAILCPFTVWAQNDLEEGERVFENERLEKIQPNSSKPDVEVPVPDLKVTKTEFKYQPQDIRFSPEVDMKDVSPMPAPIAKWDRLLTRHAKVGFGRFFSPLAQIYVRNGRDPRLDWGAELHHFSSPTGHIKSEDGKFRNAAFGDTKLGLTGKYHTGTLSFYGQSLTRFHKFNYYGDSTAPIQTKLADSLRGNFLTNDLLLGVQSYYKAGRSWYDLPLRFQHYTDKQKNTELHISFLPKVEFKVADSLRAICSGQITASSLKLPEVWGSQQETRFFIDITPTARYRIGGLTAQAGFRITMVSFLSADSVAKDTVEPRVYPVITIDYDLYNNKVVAFGGVSGATHYHTRFSLSNQNPYLSQRALAAPSYEKLRIFAGVKGHVNQLTYNVHFFRRIVENMPVFYSAPQFLPSPIEGKALARRAFFDILYEKEFTETGFSLQANFDYGQKVRSGAKLDYSSYTLNQHKHYYQMPNLRMELYGTYIAFDKLSLTAQVFVIGSRVMGLQADSTTFNQSAFVDINLEAEYLFSKRFTFFAEVNNLLNSNYYRWAYYRERPLDVRMGCTVSF